MSDDKIPPRFDVRFNYEKGTFDTAPDSPMQQHVYINDILTVIPATVKISPIADFELVVEEDPDQNVINTLRQWQEFCGKRQVREIVESLTHETLVNKINWAKMKRWRKCKRKSTRRPKANRRITLNLGPWYLIPQL